MSANNQTLVTKYKVRRSKMSKTKSQIEQEYWIDFMKWYSTDINWNGKKATLATFWDWMTHIKMPELKKDNANMAWEEL